MASKAESRDILESVGHELKESPPKILAQTRAKFGSVRSDRQRVAILLSKARAQGARIPKAPGLKPKSMKGMT